MSLQSLLDMMKIPMSVNIARLMNPLEKIIMSVNLTPFLNLLPKNYTACVNVLVTRSLHDTTGITLTILECASLMFTAAFSLTSSVLSIHGMNRSVPLRVLKFPSASTSSNFSWKPLDITSNFYFRGLHLFCKPLFVTLELLFQGNLYLLGLLYNNFPTIQCSIKKCLFAHVFKCWNGWLNAKFKSWKFFWKICYKKFLKIFGSKYWNWVEVSCWKKLLVHQRIFR